MNSEKKVRKVRRDVVAQADTWASEGREAHTDDDTDQRLSLERRIVSLEEKNGRLTSALTAPARS